MPVKIRLKRLGKKGNPYYHIVVADSRAPRDGKLIEEIGSYDPTSNPATIVLDNDKAIAWLNKGAQPTDTARAILSYKGVLYKQHLQNGVVKGVLTAEQAEEKFSTWLADKEHKIIEKRSRVITEKKKSAEEALTAESKKKEERAEIIRKKNIPPPVEEKPAEEAPAEAAAEDAAPEASAPEAPAAEGSDAPAAE
ncbi:MAG TPA: 30S ribosomal protein S16 [Bacteroidia bacterium]|nr:30S ribosomal protein S16 [Bacteroidia bacterium]